MKYRFLLISLAALAVSCSVEEVKSPELEDPNAPVFYATIDEQPDADTKVYADANLKVLWNADDRITIFNKIAYNQEFRFTGDDGDNAGSFKKVPNDDFVTGTELDKVYAVYPYRESTKISNEGIVTTTIPSEQTYLVNSFGRGANTMVAATSDNLLKFKNVGGYLSLKFYGEGVSVSSITLKSNNGELIAGECKVEMSNGLPESSMVTSNATDEITLTCETPVELGATAEEAVQFIFVLSPVTMTGGFTVTVTTPDGGIFEKSSNRERVIGRSAITPLGAMEVVPNYDNVFVQFEDENFKAYCLENFDQDGDGEISITEARTVTYIYVTNKGITSMQGVECFTALVDLRCNFNKLTSLELKNNTALVELRCEGNQLTSLDVSNNTALTKLSCQSNQLTSLDLKNNTALTWLSFVSNKLTSLDVSNNTALTGLGCSFNQLSSLDVSNNTALVELRCDSNQLTSLDLSNNTALTSLHCCENQLTSLDVSNNTALTSLFCYSNQLTSLDVSKNTNLYRLDCRSNPYLTEIWLKTGQTIEDMQYDTDIATIKYKGMENNVPFEDEFFKAYMVENFDTDSDGEISFDEALLIEEMSFYTNYMSSIKGIEYCKHLKNLYCVGPGQFEYVYGGDGKLTSIDLSQNIELTRLNCSGNQLESLDVSNNSELNWLECFGNKLTVLDVSSNTLLEYLDCSPMNDNSGNNLLKSLYIAHGQSIPNITVDRDYDLIAYNVQIVEKPEAIDLGLPSGLKWASFNLGATSPEEYGDYYAWGEIGPYYSSQDPLTWKDGKESGYCWSSYFDNPSGDGSTFEKYATDKKTSLDPEDDAAHVMLGGNWRMPTDAEWTELREYCTWTWTTQNEVNGYLVSGTNGNSVFFPAAGRRHNIDLLDVSEPLGGYYWSSSLFSDTPNRARYSFFNSTSINSHADSGRAVGFSVRPVSN